MPAESNILPPRYRGPRRIARGGMGEIYCAGDDVLGRTVAVKLLAEHYAADEAIRGRFRREALAAARLSGQPNTVTIFDVGEWNERPFIVMEYLPGGSLADRLAAEGAQPAGRVLAWLEEAAAALDAAHRNGIVHRDVKPANLLLDRDDKVRVADFGIASAAGLDSLTATGMVLGTAGYLSPEQAQGAPTTPASDRYALAVTAFELLAAERPFQRDSPTAEAAAHVEAPVPAISARRPSLPRELDAVFARGLAKDPQARHPTCAGFADEVRDAFDQAAGVTVPLARSGPRRRVGWAALAAALAAVVLLGAAVAAVVSGGGSAETRTVEHRVTLPGTTLRATVTESTTVERTTTAALPSTAPSPENADGHALNDQGYARLQQGDYEGALPLLQQAVETLSGRGPDDPYEAYANFNLGKALLELGRCDDAETYFETADRLEPHNKDVRTAQKDAQKCAERGKRKERD